MSKKEEIKKALETLELPVMVSLHDIKKRYHTLAKRYHPDRGGNNKKMEEINIAYKILKEYIENYRFSFSDEEIMKQFPRENHADKFRF
ncbi:J domain-containing protein [Nitrosophilus alvini]|uniref:J domain-containing protein n=1 Tax=Nitrosophilus alvini TaxID=2714855 RepID=UPI00190A110A|nr:J domain-containing protein [Nitrosophilus alvini]